MTLDDTLLMQWARAASTHYATGGRHTPNVDGLRARDVELACDVSNLMPILFFAARYWCGAAQPPVYVEIGTADGSSALPLLKAAAEVGGHLHSVDPSGCEDAHLLVDQFGYRAHWTHHQMPSDEFFTTFNQPIDFAFIDGDHRWPVVERDIANCYARLRPGGLVWTSDYGPFHEGTRAYEHEYNGAPYKEHVGGDAYGEAQMANGVAKAVYRVLPTLIRATSILFPIWPNASILIRKLADGELDPMKHNEFLP